MIASIIILNYQGEKIISKTIDTLLKLDYLKNDFEIIVADNNSQDNSRQIIDKYVSKYPKLIKKLYLNTNLGFGLGNNEAIKISNGKYIILLNNDCLVDANWLSELTKLADSKTNIFSISSKLKKYPAELNQIQNAGSLIFQDGYGRDIGAIVTSDHQQFYETDNGQYDQSKEVYSSCGAAVLFQKSILDKIGLFDDNFFMYYEDTEICERALLSGYKNLYCPKAVVYHHHAASSKEWSNFFIYHTERGRLLHIFYHFPTNIFVKEYFKFTFKAKLRLINSLIKQKNIFKSWQYLRVSLFYFLNFSKLITRRRLYSNLYKSKNRQLNYQKILSGYWYFN